MRTDGTAVSEVAQEAVEEAFAQHDEERGLGPTPVRSPLAINPNFNMDFMSGISLSGHERNHLFLNRAGERFAEVSGISGIDHQADGRAVAWLDFDRDGWLDLVVVNANAPLTQLYRNRLGEVGSKPPGRMVAVRLVGANRAAVPDPERSPRDGYGARVVLELSDGTRLLRELRAGEGFASQNSSTLRIGIGPDASVDALTVRWPSGQQQRFAPIEAGQLLTVHEDASETPDGSGLLREPYGRPAADERPSVAPAQQLPFVSRLPGRAALNVLITTATWCESCKGELPALSRLRKSFAASEVALFGVPIDPADDGAKLEAFVRDHDPAYAMLSSLPQTQRDATQAAIVAELQREGLPASVVTDRDGRVLSAQWGAPSISTLRRLAAEAR
ncbi:MAG: ASPIC/UnbV domain-containing protein [Myxococcales bacterium]|nr:ASPIC/UnbV domain-containing protein [Myxococcales bacterium]